MIDREAFEQAMSEVDTAARVMLEIESAREFLAASGIQVLLLANRTTTVPLYTPLSTTNIALVREMLVADLNAAAITAKATFDAAIAEARDQVA